MKAKDIIEQINNLDFSGNTTKASFELDNGVCINAHQDYNEYIELEVYHKDRDPDSCEAMMCTSELPLYIDVSMFIEALEKVTVLQLMLDGEDNGVVGGMVRLDHMVYEKAFPIRANPKPLKPLK